MIACILGMSVTQDATSLKYVPASGAEYTTLLAGSGIANPVLLYLCQEASGNLVDTISGVTLTLSHGTPQFQQTITGWARKAVVCRAGQSDEFSSTSATLPDLTTQSALVVAWVHYPSTASGADIFTFGTPYLSGQVLLRGVGGPKLEIGYGTNNLGTDSTNTYSNYTDLVMLQWNRAASPSPTIICDTDQERFSTQRTVSSSSKGFFFGGDNGADHDNAFGVGVLHCAVWTGANAELTGAQLTTLRSLMNNGPAGAGRLIDSPLTSSNLTSSPLVGSVTRRAMPGPPRYYEGRI